jgi:hypothetical protein
MSVNRKHTTTVLPNNSGDTTTPALNKYEQQQILRTIFDVATKAITPIASLAARKIGINENDLIERPLSFWRS